MTAPTVDPAINTGGSFTMSGQITTTGTGSWNESGDMYWEWDQGTSTWASIAGTGDLYTLTTNPVTGLQTTDVQSKTIYSDGTAGSFQVRIKLVEDDLTEHTTTPVDVTVSSPTGNRILMRSASGELLRNAAGNAVYKASTE